LLAVVAAVVVVVLPEIQPIRVMEDQQVPVVAQVELFLQMALPELQTRVVAVVAAVSARMVATRAPAELADRDWSFFVIRQPTRLQSVPV
jgi:Tfp pilus assembly PilM family ATPase